MAGVESRDGGEVTREAELTSQEGGVTAARPKVATFLRGLGFAQNTADLFRDNADGVEGGPQAINLLIHRINRVE